MRCSFLVNKSKNIYVIVDYQISLIINEKSCNDRVSRITRQLNSEGFFDILKFIRLTLRYRELSFVLHCE